MSKRLFKSIDRFCLKFTLLLLSMAFSWGIAMAQTKTISGKVVDAATGEALSGVSIKQKKYSTATTSGRDGSYRITIRDVSEPVLVFTYVGYLKQELPVSGLATLNVRLELDSRDMDEVVVVGYGTQKKETVVGAIGHTSGDAILKQNVPEVANALAGLMPGVATIQTNSMPGGSGTDNTSTRIYIRGRTTWNSAQPLILVDGVERSIDDVDAFEIDKISILKDASATAVFGVKGANGVVLITTKRGKAGKATLHFDAQGTVNTLSRQPTVMNSYDGNVYRNAAIINEMAVNPSAWPEFKPQEILNYYKTQEYPDIFPDVNWLDEFTNDYSTSHRENLSIRGGTKFVKYYGSLSYLQQGDLIATKDYGQGYDPSFDYKRFNFRSNLDFNFTRSTKVSINLAGLYGVQRSPNGNNSEYATFWKALYGHPPDVYPVRYSDGTWGENIAFDKFLNGVTAVNFNGVKSDNRTQINTDLMLEQKLDFVTQGLSVTGRISFDNYFTTSGTNISDDGVVTKYIPPTVIGLPMDEWENYAIYNYPATSTNGYEYTDEPVTYVRERARGQRRSTDYQVNLNYVRSFGNHDISALALFKRTEAAAGDNYLSKREDWVGRLTYAYRSKYLFEFNGAYNGSEQFGPEYRLAFFPSVAVGWVLSEEKFFEKLHPVVDVFKLRYSNGKVGNDQVGGDRWSYLSNRNPISRAWQFGAPFTSGTGNPIILEGNIANPNIHWEVSHKQNIGLDAAFLKNRLTLAFDYFWEDNTEMFVNKNLRTGNDIFGAQLPSANIGAANSRGWELDLGYTHQFSKAFSVTGRYTQSFVKVKILEIDDPVLKPDYQKKAGFTIGQIRTQVNQPGLIQSWDEVYTGVLALDNNSFRLPGDFRQIDYNADGHIDGDDAVPYGYSGYPQYTHSLNLGLRYKGFNAGILFYGVWNVSFTTNHDEFNEGYTVINDFIAKNAWNPEAGLTEGATYNGLRLYTTSPKGNYRVEDASYTRIKSAELGYTFSNKLISKLRLKTMKVYLRGYNLALWSEMIEDRESQAGTLSNRTLAYPLTKSYTLGFSLGF